MVNQGMNGIRGEESECCATENKLVQHVKHSKDHFQHLPPPPPRARRELPFAPAAQQREARGRFKEFSFSLCVCVREQASLRQDLSA
jgi:hypothetical protein